MAPPALLPDITPSRIEKTPSTRSPAASRGDQNGDSFERVQKNLSKAARPKPGQSERSDTHADAKTSKGEDGKPGSPQETAEPALEATSNPHRDSTSTVEERRQGWAPPDRQNSEDAFLPLFMPVAEPAVSGDLLPVPAVSSLSSSPAGASPAPAGDLQGLMGMRQLMTGGAAGAKVGEIATDGGKAVGEIDLGGFKASLAEAVAGRAPDVTAPALVTSQRGLELREGTTLVRPYSTTVETPVQQQGEWGDRMAGKISWLANQRISLAEIHLNPADMGPVEVRVSVQNDQASVSLHAQNPSVRDLLELNGSRLRDMLQDNGLNLAKMDVSDQPSRQQQRSGDESGQGRRATGPDRDEPALVSLEGEGTTTGEVSLPWVGQVNTYA